ncbi:MAG: acyltransferase [Ruminococcus sp.]|nr:acyltransferase [Ruminococcus sp.]
MKTKCQVQSSKVRDSYFQMWRGICIVIVVLMHCFYPPFQTGTFDGMFFFLEINSINFPVAVFFVLSGYFVKESSFSSDRLKSTLISRIKKLIVPYFIYTVLYMGFAFVLGREFTISYVLRSMFLGQAATPLYYILVLFFFTLLTPLLIKCIHRKVLSFMVFVLSFLVLATFYVLKFSGYDLWFYSRYTIVWLPFYYFGILMRNCEIHIPKQKGILLAFTGFALCLEICESIFIYYYTGSTAIALSQIRFFAFIYAFSIALIMFSNYKVNNEQSDNIAKRLFVYLGDNSYGIYFIHMFYITILSVLLEKFVIEQLVMAVPAFLFSFAELFMAITFSVLTIKVLRLVFKKTGSLLFGV